MPIHIHVTKSGAAAKYNVYSKIKLAKNAGFKKSELKIIESIIIENKEIIIERWTEFFNEK